MTKRNEPQARMAACHPGYEKSDKEIVLIYEERYRHEGKITRNLYFEEMKV